MSTSTTDTSEIVQREYFHDGYLIDEIEHIDLSDLNFDDIDNWLYIPIQCSTESAIENLYIWLKTEPELNVRSKKCIDSRTFTRPKKRSARMNFESIFEGLPPSVANTLKLQNADLMHIGNVNKHSSIIGNKESVPPMLIPSSKAAANILSDDSLILSGQESMEIFLNMSQSKGIDSFINLGEPEFNDPLMNISQPSVLYTSIISSINESVFTKNDSVSPINKDTVTQKIIHQHSNVKETSISKSTNETFIMQDANDIITPNKTYCAGSLNSTFRKETVQPGRDLNETYNTKDSDEVSALISNFNEKEIDINVLPSILATDPNIDINLTQLQHKASNNINSLNTTFIPSPKGIEKQDPIILTKNDKPAMQAIKANLNITCNISSNETKSAAFLETDIGDALNTTFKVPICSQSTPINPNMLNTSSKLAMKHLDQPRQILYSVLKAPTSLRRELLAEVQRSDERKLDFTYNHVSSDPHLKDTKKNTHISDNENVRNETDIASESKYHTYRKLMLTTNQFKNQNECDATIPARKEFQDRKFHTFTKKNNFIEKTENNEKAEVPPNMDGTFCKFLPKTERKYVHAPKMFSKLPQFLQKSNPNLVSNSLKTASISGYTGISSIGYIKGSQPNIVQNMEKSLPNKLHPFGKLKSGSEQRLLEVNVNRTEFKTKDTTGSTESIESIQSAHSAPDFDDRLNICSDSSHNSFKRPTMDIEQLHQIVRLQEESLKQDSIPRANTRVLENTWIEEKTDLLSPIQKNGTEYCEVNTDSPISTDLNIKCSSPITNPIESSHISSNDGNPKNEIMKSKENIAVVGKIEDSNQIVPKIGNKTRLRQPTNWNTGSKAPSTVISGIPRPASRIPALRFTRPNVKTAQSDLKKECM